MFKWLGGLMDSNDKELKRLQLLVDNINELEPQFERLNDTELRAKTDEFKDRLKTDSSLDELLPEAFAAIREAASRTIGQRHFDVQLMGGIILHQGKIAEMKTGEGKTLVATLPLYLNSLTGQGCHLVTVNDYLAKRDHHWMGPIYHALGVTVASIQHETAFIYDPSYESEDQRWAFLRPIPRRQAYEADITHGTNNEFAFDYLRDNMIADLSQCVQRPLNYTIIDEVDNILIDEARTPLIISGPAKEAEQKYQIFARLIPRLHQDVDYTVDIKSRAVSLTDVGISNMETVLKREGLLKSPNLYDPSNYSLTRYLESAIKAYVLYKRDRNYVVKDGQVIIVDEFTGRLMPGRRYSEGLHQAIEAKERVKVQRESMTFATVTFQNYFRMYDKLAGMTGTAITEAEEFYKIYQLEVIVIPTNKPMIRKDSSDRIYTDEKTKFNAAVREIEQLYQEKRPVLIGTVSIDKSETLSDLLRKKGVPHQVLNAKYHEQEASIIAQAGRLGAVTVATNMAGRGVDIVLGGNPTGRSEKEWQQEHKMVVDLGGLSILGTERHEARRIDNQLRGRAGRQGDPGSSRFYVSFDDDVIKRFGGDRPVIKGLMARAGVDEETPIENRLVNKTIEGAQVRVEGYHFDVRKHLVEYDDVVNQQREIIYSERRKILSGADLKTNILSMVKEEIQDIVTDHTGDEHGNSWDIDGLIAGVSTILTLSPGFEADALASLKPGQINDKFTEQAEALYQQREQENSPDNMRVLERLVMLRTIDSLWVEHLTAMEDMRQQAGWQSLRQVKAVDAYKKEGYKQFQVLLSTIRHDVASAIYHASLVRQEAKQPTPSLMSKVATASRAGNNNLRTQKEGHKKIGRNDFCPCGSGKKYKYCCGR
ncbi:preprotein translocase subunit SecA [Chloroflexota bacterium]